MQILMLILFSFGFVMANAQEIDPSRTIQLEWEEVLGATSYDLEVTSTQNKTEVFKVSTPNWSGKLSPGKYFMRIRSRDHRKVPGAWSEKSDFAVGLAKPVLTEQPAKIQGQAEQDLIKLSWQPVPLAQKYIVTIASQDGVFNKTEETPTAELQINLPSAQEYTWSVQAVLDEDIQSEVSQQNSFTLLGPVVPTPAINEPKGEYVRLLEWAPTGESYTVILHRWDTNTQKWRPFKKLNLTQNNLDFSADWPGGKYILIIQSQTKLRPSSAQARMKFSVREGDRSPAAEQMELTAKPILRTHSGWFASSSFAINSLDYRNTGAGNGNYTRYKVNGSLIRLSFGHDRAEKTWGFVSHYELASYLFDGTVNNFHNLSALTTYKILNGSIVSLRLKMGGYYRETPESSSSPSSTHISDSKTAHLGLQLGGELGLAVTSRLGLKLGLNTFLPFGTLESPTGGNSYSHLGHEAGAQAYFRINRDLTTSIVISHREEKFSFPVHSGSGGSSTQITNESDLSNSAIGIAAEWSF